MGIDSLGRVELLLRIEQHFAVTLPEQILATAETPGDLLHAIKTAKISKRAQTDSGTVRIPREPDQAIEGGPPEKAETLIEVLDWHAEAHPKGIHIHLYGDGESEELITYADLKEGAGAIAAGLVERQIEPGQSVAIMLPTGRDYFYAFFGILSAGCIPVPLYPPARLSQIEEHMKRHAIILKNALARLLITIPEAKTLAMLLKSQVETMKSVVTAEEISTKNKGYRFPKPKAADIAFLQYTSGTTGNPKGVMLSHANLLANIRAMGEVTEASSKDVFVSWLPLYHDMGLIGAWLGSLYYGMKFVVMSPLTFLARPERWLWAIHKHRGTISGGPNFGYELGIRRLDEKKLEGLDLSSWRMAFNGAEPVSHETMNQFCEVFKDYGFNPKACMPVYGLAEASVGLTFPPLNRGPLVDEIRRETLMHSGRAEPAEEGEEETLHFVACGRPLPGHQIRIVDDFGREVEERREGRLQFRGPSTTSGYFRNRQASEELFDGEWLNSGDRAYMAGGDLYLTGRIKDVIIRAGRNIYPYELEEAIGKIEGIRKGCVAVFGTTDISKGTERLVVIAETKEREFSNLDTIQSEINSVSADIIGMPPEDVLLAPPRSVLKTSSGKIRRSATRDLYEKEKIGWRQYPVWWQFLRLTTASLIPQLRRARLRSMEFIYASYAWPMFYSLAIITWTMVAIMPNIRWRRSFIRHMSRLAVWLSGNPFTVRGLENIPSRSPCIIASNHASYIDVIVTAAVFPPFLSYVAKRELTSRFVPRLFLSRIGIRFVERFDMERGLSDAKKISETVQQGNSMVFFPEGTFDRMPGLLPFHMGAFITAAEAGIPIVPVTLRGTRSVLRSESWFPRRGAITVTIGEPILPEGSGWKAAIKLREATRASMLEHCGEPDLTL